MFSTSFLVVLLSVVASINCLYVGHDISNLTTRDAVTVSLAQSLHGIADALLANSQQSSCSCLSHSPCQPVPATTCEEIKKRWPTSASGYYTVGGKKFTVI